VESPKLQDVNFLESHPNDDMLTRKCSDAQNISRDQDEIGPSQLAPSWLPNTDIDIRRSIIDN
jgi:hypothetical protein